MRKIMFALICLFLVASILVACAPAAPTVYTDDKTPITAGAGEQFTIELKSNPTTGFSWQADYDKTILTQTAKDYVADATKAGVVGAGGVDKFSFAGVKAGTTKITFTYKRTWESVPPAETKTFNITIR
jgi:inhibitor of cysteine peptidase